MDYPHLHHLITNTCYWRKSIQGKVWNDESKPITIIQGNKTALDCTGDELERSIQTQMRA